MTTASIELVIALPNKTTSTLYIDPTMVVLSEIFSDGSKSFLPAAEVQNVIVFGATPGQWTENAYVVAGVISSTPSSQPPQSTSLDIDAFPNPCVCVSSTNLTFVQVTLD